MRFFFDTHACCTGIVCQYGPVNDTAMALLALLASATSFEA
jgi:hypothetical protein